MRNVIVTTSWDDGHRLDERLAEMLRKYKVAATFYVSPNDHEFDKKDLLNDEQIRQLSKDFEVGAHTMTHPRLTEVDDTIARQEMAESKKYLEKVIGKPVVSFCYPGGNYFKKHVAMVCEVGFSYARTVKRYFFRLKGAPQESHTSVNVYNHYQDLWKILKFAGFNPFKVPYYFQWQNLAKAMFDKVQREGGVFHLWGHSWEIDAHGDWEKLEDVLQYISGHADVKYATNGELPGLSKPRLLIATPYFPPEVGGVEHYAFEMAHGAVAEGYDVTVVTSGKANEIVHQNGFRVYRLKTQFVLANTPVGLGWYWQLKRIISQEDPDVVNVHAPVPFLPDLAAMASGRRPLIVTYHSGSMHKNRVLIDWAIGLYERLWLPRMLHKARRIICSSDFVRNGFLVGYAEKTLTITPGVDTERFKKRSFAPHTKRVLFVGNFRSGNKGLQYLQQAIAGIPDAELHVVGEGDQTPSERTIYHGALRDEKLVEQYHLADVMVLPSVGATESFGMVLVEAMACGIPVIGSNIGGIPTVITDGKDGLLVAPKNVEALTVAIKDTLENPAKADALAEAAYKKVHRLFTWQLSVTEFMKTADLVMQNRPTIVHVAGYYPPHLGGMENVAKALAEGLAADDYDVRVLTSNSPVAPKQKQKNLSVQRFNAVDFAHTPFALGFIGAILRIPRHSIVHLHLAQAFYPEWVWFACRLRRIPYLVHFHLDLQPSGPFGKIFLVYKAVVLRQVIRDAQKVTVFSDEQRQFIHQKYGLSLEKIAIVPNGVGQDYFKEARTYKKATRKLLFVGRLASQKRVDRLIGAMKQLNADAHLTIVGDGESRAALEKQAEGLSNVTFVGRKNAAETKVYYEQSDVLVVSSDQEGMSLVTLEAMASALPIVASKAPGLTELLDGVGVLVENPSPETFATALDAVLPDSKKLNSLSAKSLAAAKQYSWPKVVAMFEELYKDISS